MSGRKGRKRAGAAEGTGTERRRIRTLIVDDSAFVVESLEGFFRGRDGFEVVGVAGTGLEAVERVARLMPDLVLMDSRMPGMDGVAATRRIKAREDAPVVIMFTLEDSESIRAAAKAAGVDDFVAKVPAAVDGLRAAIRRTFPEVKVRQRK